MTSIHSFQHTAASTRQTDRQAGPAASKALTRVEQSVCLVLESVIRKVLVVLVPVILLIVLVSTAQSSREDGDLIAKLLPFFLRHLGRAVHASVSVRTDGRVDFMLRRGRERSGAIFCTQLLLLVVQADAAQHVA